MRAYFLGWTIDLLLSYAATEDASRVIPFSMIASPLPLLVVVSAIVVLAVTGNLFSSNPVVIALQIAAIALNLWARRSFQKGTFRVTAAPTTGSIMRNGPYRFIRHPMYASVLLFIWTAVASHLSVLTLTIGVVVTAVVMSRVVVEERLLRARYPDYADYARSTKAVVPFVL